MERHRSVTSFMDDLTLVENPKVMSKTHLAECSQTTSLHLPHSEIGCLQRNLSLFKQKRRVHAISKAYHFLTFLQKSAKNP